MLTRSFSIDSKEFFLVVDLDSLETKVIDSIELSSFKKSDNAIDTNYALLVKKVFENSSLLENAGINSSFRSDKLQEIYLTIDMCPSSKKGFEKEFYQNIINLSTEHKIPISIAITNKWIKTHTKDFEWILKNKEYLDITWINHSANHYYDKNEKDLAKNFMLHDISAFEQEILDVEKMLLINGQTPSILFRFPGLISNKSLIKDLVEKYSLIPLGTNNWLAKDNKSIQNRDIILVHGNLNEHKGIQIFNNNIFEYKLGSLLGTLKIK